MKLQPRDHAILDAIREAARAGKPCPTNDTLSEIGGFSCTSGVTSVLRKFRNAGLIEVRLVKKRRVVTIDNMTTKEVKFPSRGPAHTDESDGFIRAHYKKDMRATQIGERLGMTRGQVVGRALVLGLRDSKDQHKNKPQKVTQNSKAMEKGADMRHRGDPLATRLVPRAQEGWRPKACQWIEGAPSINESCKCRKPVLEGSSYCSEHHERCWYMPRAA
jgi:hypothetical protein